LADNEDSDRIASRGCLFGRLGTECLKINKNQYSKQKGLAGIRFCPSKKNIFANPEVIKSEELIKTELNRFLSEKTLREPSKIAPIFQ
jgi:hypothetical protein